MSDSAESAAPTSVTLPLTFSNSFWTQDYRTGFETLYNALDARLVQSDELLAHVRQRAHLEGQLADSLLPPALRLDGFAADEGASLRMGFEAVLTSVVSEARARQALAEDLTRSILHPFSSWSSSHAGRIRSSRSLIESHLAAYEKSKSSADRLKALYDEACRYADAVEDELNFSRARVEAERERGGASPGGLGATDLPPRPEEIDRLTPSRQRKPVKGNDSDSDEGVGDDDDDDTLVGRSGATGGSVVAALGRAFSMRRPAPRRRAQSGDGAPGSPREEKVEEEDEDADEKGQPFKEGVEGLKRIVESDEVKKGVEWSRTKFTSLLSRVQGPQSGEDRWIRARKAADEAEDKYKKEVETLDGLRLTLEETLSSHLPYVQRCEADRLKAAASVLKSYHAAVAALPRLVVESHDRVGKALELVRAEKDVRGLVERRRTGPFSPRPILYTSHYAEPPLTTFGIDLRKFDETNADKDAPEPEKVVPPLLQFLLRWIGEEGAKLSDEERRKSWLYETPLSAQHRLRSLLNSPSTLSLPFDSLAALLSRPHPDTGEAVDVPVACSTVKLWLLELEVPVVPFERYDELRALFPTRVGGVDEVDKEEVAKVVGKLPRVHYEVLKLIVTHLSTLLSSTTTDEPTDVYLQKLSLSLARALLRPKTETALTLSDRFPALLVALLIKHSSSIFPAAEEAARKVRDERYRPRRQRTKPIDVRPTRGNLGIDPRESVDLGKASEVLRQQIAAEAGAPPVPPLPANVAAAAPASDREAPKRASLLGVDTAVPPPTTLGGSFAASPLSATAEELPAAPSVPSSSAEPAAPSAHEPAPSAPAPSAPPAAADSDDEFAREAPFVPPSASSAVEGQDGKAPQDEPFTPPVASAPPADDADTDAAPAAEGEGDQPLSSSSSLKRTPGAGRLRGARGPRPPSQVMARAAMWENQGQGQEASKRESWTRTRAEGGVDEGVEE
ncbi:hypothetical protein JCM10207_008991 [Rhodosporidiobolus poonsookiae]